MNYLKKEKTLLPCFTFKQQFSSHFNNLLWSYDPQNINYDPWKVEKSFKKKFSVNSTKPINNFELLKKGKKLYYLLLLHCINLQDIKNIFYGVMALKLFSYVPWNGCVCWKLKFFGHAFLIFERNIDLLILVLICQLYHLKPFLVQRCIEIRNLLSQTDIYMCQLYINSR